MILFGGRNLTLVIIIIVCDLIAFEAGFVTGTRVKTLEKSRIFPNYEICNRYNGRRIYLDLGEQGVLKATNITVPNLTNVRIRSNRILFCFSSIFDLIFISWDYRF